MCQTKHNSGIYEFGTFAEVFQNSNNTIWEKMMTKIFEGKICLLFTFGL